MKLYFFFLSYTYHLQKLITLIIIDEQQAMAKGGHSDKAYNTTFRRRSYNYCSTSSGRITILFAWCITLVMAISDAAAAATAATVQRTSATAQNHHHAAAATAWPYSTDGGGGDDVQVFGNARDGIRSQSISFAAGAADPNGGSVERFPRQLDTVHDHLMGRERRRQPIETKQKKKMKTKKKKTFDSEYDRFINEHFRQQPQQPHQTKESSEEKLSPETESEQMARDHERFQELPHYHRKSHPEDATPPPLQLADGNRQHRLRPKTLKTKRPSTIQEDVEDYQPNDETIAVRSYSGHQTTTMTPDEDDDDNDYQRIKQLSEQQAKEEDEEDQEEEEGNQQTHHHRQCKVTQKEDMLCQTCVNPRTGAKSESCSYASQPRATEYAYRKANHYGSKKNDDDDKERDADSTEGQGISDAEDDEDDPEIHTSHPLRKRNQSSMDRTSRSRTKREGGKSAGRWRRRRIGNDWTESVDGEERPSSSSGKSKKKDTTYEEDFFASLFPEFPKYHEADLKVDHHEDYERLMVMPSTAGSGAEKKDVERALAEFRKRDWSDCKKTLKGELTCYECGDKLGVVQHEQCLHVSDAEWEEDDRNNSTTGGMPPPPRDEAAASKSVGVIVVGAVKGQQEHPPQQHQHKRDNVAELARVELPRVDEWMGRNNNNVTATRRRRIEGGEGVSRNNKKNKANLNRKLVIKKRKLKQQQQSDYAGEAAPVTAVPSPSVPERDTSADDQPEVKVGEQQQKRPVKRRIRKKVTYRKTAKNVKHHQQKSGQGGKEELHHHQPVESRVMEYYGQKVTHS